MSAFVLGLAAGLAVLGFALVGFALIPNSPRAPMKHFEEDEEYCGWGVIAIVVAVALAVGALVARAVA